MKKLLLIGANHHFEALVDELLKSFDVDISRAEDAHQAARILMRENIDVVFVDGKITEQEIKILMRMANVCNPDCKVITGQDFFRSFRLEEMVA